VIDLRSGCAVVGDHDAEKVHRMSDLLAERLPGAPKRVIAGADSP